MSDLYRVNLSPAGEGGGISSQQPSSGDYSSLSGSFSQQGDRPTSAREALQPPTQEPSDSSLSTSAPAVGETAGQRGQEGGTGLGASATPPPAPSPWTALRETAKGLGVTLPDDDQAALHALVSAYQNAGRRDYYSELGAAIAPQYSQFQAWQQQQEAQRAAQQQQPTSPWSPPPFDPQWLRVVEEDPQTGRLRSKQGYDPRFGDACQAYADYISGNQRSFWENPPAWIAQMIGPTVQKMIHDGVNGSFRGYQEQVQANTIIQRNTDWLYAKDQNGNVLVSPQTGRPQLSPYGARYYQYVEQAAGWGMSDINQQHEYAMGMVERDAYRNQYTTAAQQVGQQPAAQAAQRVPNVNSLQTMVQPSRSNVQPTSQPSNTGLSFAEMLRNDLKSEGIDDSSLKAQLSNY